MGKPAGYGYTDTTDKAILVSIDPATLLGTYDETNFQRFDLVLADACKLSTLLWHSQHRSFVGWSFVQVCSSTQHKLLALLDASAATMPAI